MCRRKVPVLLLEEMISLMGLRLSVSFYQLIRLKISKAVENVEAAGSREILAFYKAFFLKAIKSLMSRFYKRCQAFQERQ